LKTVDLVKAAIDNGLLFVSKELLPDPKPGLEPHGFAPLLIIRESSDTDALWVAGRFQSGPDKAGLKLDWRSYTCLVPLKLDLFENAETAENRWKPVPPATEEDLKKLEELGFVPVE
jgi:hypothetical protein